ncbi:hypothetical protein I2485_07360 [Nesterenkonia sp. E16_7]|uniref:LysM peptidoglycan-binding domain-containing protein n=1 Tax=unclassified Nesterenkonia TaxID=2629769 RepID=UPI001A9327F8|nr:MULTISPECIES: LysM domain-containing protein [unclassified Nesterenkonia]MBO0594321.1 hypothetical protein [Nesterenkonia sp. E16_10]MBO0598469.1 hypothetical protein [Nesterenkonia sp. E16_7]
MGSRSEASPSPVSEDTGARHRLGDLMLSLVFIASGPVLWSFGAAILDQQPDLGTRVDQAPNQHGIDAAETLLGLLAAASGLLISGGALIAVLAILAQHIAHRCGAWRVEGLLTRCSPGFMRRSAALTLGAGLALTTMAAGPWQQPQTTETVQSVTTPAEIPAQNLDPNGEIDDDVDGSPEEVPDSVLFDTTEPEVDPGAPGSADHPDHPDPGHPGPGTPAPHPDRLGGLPTRPGSGPEQIVVRLGDSLWDIAAEHLGPDATDWEIAASWPEWYAENRDRIGADPGLILPGMILTVPAI